MPEKALPAALPRVAGAYALTFRLDAETVLPIARLGFPALASGLYVYAGSARGPGGIAARVARHLRAEKTPHWHVDHLSARADCVDVQAFPGGRECDVVSALLAAGAVAPVPGFGSSDCRVCPAHLLRLTGDVRSARLLLSRKTAILRGD